MARTKQTARRSTGGRAPNMRHAQRRQRQANHPLGHGVTLPLPLPPPEGEQRNEDLVLDEELRGYFNEVHLVLKNLVQVSFLHYTINLILQDLENVQTPLLTDAQVIQWNHVQNLQLFEAYTANEGLSGHPLEQRAQQDWTKNVYRLTGKGSRVVHPGEDSLSIERK